MNRRTKFAVGGAAVAVVLAAGTTGIAIATSTSDDNEVPITGDAYDRAAAAAIEVTGGGEVTETEVGDEEGFYEVEITLDDGSQVDVRLDENFNHIGSEADSETDDDDEGSDDG